MYWTNDPIRDAERYFADLDEKESRLPVCHICKDVIYDDDSITDMYGNIYCRECWDKQE